MAKREEKIMLRVSDEELARIDRLVEIDHSTRAAILRKGVAALESKQEEIERLCSGEVSHA